MPNNDSLADSLRNLPKNERERRIAKLSNEQALEILYDWSFWARPNQLPPKGNWSTWIRKAGRGEGKTRTGAEWVRDQMLTNKVGRLALIAKDPGEARDVMIEGESGILAVHHPRTRPNYQSSKKRITWDNGAKAFIYSSEDPEELRGPQHEKGWIDEFAKQKNQQDVWDNYQFGLRLGNNPQTLITTTPRPTKVLKSIIKDPHTIVTGGSTYDNRANLPQKFFEAIIGRYEGTRLGRQEIYAELLEDTPGALWTLKLIDDNRRQASYEEMDKVVVGVDPMAIAKTQAERAQAEMADKLNRTGIIVCGCRMENSQRHGYVLADRSLHGKPKEWAAAVVKAYRDFGANYVVAEANNGGDMVEAVIQAEDPTIPVKLVHASRGKYTRAEPISTLTEKELIHHCDIFTELEDQMSTYIPGEHSPDNMDAMVWGMTELMESGLVDLSQFNIEVMELETARGPW